MIYKDRLEHLEARFNELNVKMTDPVVINDADILAYNLKAFVATFDWGMPMQDAINLPNLISRGSAAFGELDRFDPALVQSMHALGLDVLAPRGEQSGLQGLMRLPDGRLTGGADPRREGVVLIHH